MGSTILTLGQGEVEACPTLCREVGVGHTILSLSGAGGGDDLFHCACGGRPGHTVLTLEGGT